MIVVSRACGEAELTEWLTLGRPSRFAHNRFRLSKPPAVELHRSTPHVVHGADNTQRLRPPRWDSQMLNATEATTATLIRIVVVIALI